MSTPNDQPHDGSEAPRHDPYAALRIGDYRFFLTGWFLAVIGSQIQATAVGWEIFERTKSAWALGWLGLLQAAPVIGLALPAGQLADRHSRRSIFIITQALAGASSIGLAVVSHLQAPIGWMYLFILTTAVVTAIGWPARAALMPQIVPTAIFSNATMWSSSAFQTAMVVGPAVAGAVLIFSLPAAYLVDAGCSMACVAMMAFLKIRLPARPREPATLKTLLAGVRFVWRAKAILATITLDLFAVLLGGAVYLLPIYSEQILKVGPIGFGWLRAAPAVGALLMALVLAHRPPMRHAGKAMLWAVAGFGVATIVFGLSKNFWLSLAMLFLTGAFDNISVVVRHSLVQMLTPDAMRGRVSAVNNVFIGASNELGGFESGMTAALLGPVASVVAGGVGTILVVLGIGYLWPQVRRIGTLHDLKPLEEEAVAALSPPRTTSHAT